MRTLRQACLLKIVSHQQAVQAPRKFCKGMTKHSCRQSLRRRFAALRACPPERLVLRSMLRQHCRSMFWGHAVLAKQLQASWLRRLPLTPSRHRHQHPVAALAHRRLPSQPCVQCAAVPLQVHKAGSKSAAMLQAPSSTCRSTGLMRRHLLAPSRTQQRVRREPPSSCARCPAPFTLCRDVAASPQCFSGLRRRLARERSPCPPAKCACPSANTARCSTACTQRGYCMSTARRCQPGCCRVCVAKRPERLQQRWTPRWRAFLQTSGAV